MAFFKLISDRKGQTMLETAIVLPVVIFILFSIIVYGFALNSKIALTLAAREAARTYAVYKDEARMRDTAESILKTAIPMSQTQFNQSFNKNTDVTYTVNPTTNCVEVSVSFRQPTLFPGLFRLVGGSNMGNYFNMSSRAVFRIEP